jgi:hypothetical protein
VHPVLVDCQVALSFRAPAPNPAPTSASPSLAVKEQADTGITLYNMLGQQVTIAHNGIPQTGERQTARVDVSGLPSGTYFLRFQANGKTVTRLVTVLW